jgi:hypothetical protein
LKGNHHSVFLKEFYRPLSEDRGFISPTPDPIPPSLATTHTLLESNFVVIEKDFALPMKFLN